MITCSTCGKSKADTDFSWRSRSKGTRQTTCKACASEYSAQHYRRNPEPYKRRARESRPRIRMEVTRFLLNYLATHPCVDCGESDIEVLEFDHRESVGQKAIRVFGQTSIVGAKREIERCDVRCANCHTRRTRVQLGRVPRNKLLKQLNDE